MTDGFFEHGYVTVAVHLHHVTERAYLVSGDGERDHAVWVPRSQCEDVYNADCAGNAIELGCTAWIAETKGLL